VFQSQRPSVHIFIFASTKLLTKDPHQNAMIEAKDDARRIAEYVFHRLLIVLPMLGGRRWTITAAMIDAKHERREAAPDDPSIPRISIDLREDVPEEIRDRKEQDARHERDGAEHRHVDCGDLRRPDEVRTQQKRRRTPEDQVVILVILHEYPKPRVEKRHSKTKAPRQSH